MHDLKAHASWREAIFHTVGLWLFILLIFLPMMLERHRTRDLASVALDGSAVLLSMLLALGLFALYRRTLGWPNLQRAAILLAGVVAAALAQTLFDYLVTSLVERNFMETWQDLPQNMRRRFGAAFNYFCVFAVNVALFQFAFARRWSAARDRQLAEARERAQQAQLTALRYQLNPHFLFNTLNSISALIVTRRNDDAEEMTEKLSRFLRTSLAFDPSELVPVDEELSLVEEYLDIEAVRFGRKLSIALSCEPAAGGQLIPGFLVQPLVENAVKHGVAPARGLVTIRIAARLEGGMVCIRVENDRVDLPEEESSAGAGVGLANVRRRLEAVYGAAASLTTDADERLFSAEIRIPASKRDGRTADPAGDSPAPAAPAAARRRDKPKSVAV
ncbi:histidine kinase [Sphingomonas parva]|uniref:Histidine kinase n=1 Tax=Sphingomonas parva TaxID=2555898 RepID=A0A4Y8ZX66_9SPHN|nr:histidine kinase [Sphingomonas parva]TFI59096.1 histidine kinase [Sphingomonas parva]